jgi:hypothetical protein
VRIGGLIREVVDDRARVSAVFRFEDCDLPERRIYIEAAGHLAADLQPSPDAFLLIGLPIACWMGERRVQVEGSVCTALRENLGEAMRLYAHWYERVEPLAVEATTGFCVTTPRAPRRTAAYLSGGVDSLATLRTNREAYPLEHPDAIREAIFVRGLYGNDHLADGELRPERARDYDQSIQRLQTFAARVHLDLAVLTTNARQLYPDWPAYRDIGWGAVLVAQAHALSARCTDVQISSSGLPLPIPPHGSHPLLDGLYSTAALQAAYPLPFRSRFEKLALLADWPTGLQVLDVCFRDHAPDGRPLNCGACSKCMRTMLGLLALGRLAETPTFPQDDLTAQQVLHMPMPGDLQLAYLAATLPHLETAGRADLAEALRHRIHRWRTRNSLRRRLSRALRRVPRAP